MVQTERNIEFRLVLMTDMSEDQLDEFLEEIKKEVLDHLLVDEEIISTLWSDKISYESKQLMKELGVE